MWSAVRPCNRAAAAEVRRAKGILYLAETGNTTLVLVFVDDLGVLKDIAREAMDYSVEMERRRVRRWRANTLDSVKIPSLEYWAQSNTKDIEWYNTLTPKKDWKKMVNNINGMVYDKEYFPTSVYDRINIPVMIVLGDRDERPELGQRFETLCLRLATLLPGLAARSEACEQVHVFVGRRGELHLFPVSRHRHRQGRVGPRNTFKLLLGHRHSSSVLLGSASPDPNHQLQRRARADISMTR